MTTLHRRTPLHLISLVFTALLLIASAAAAPVHAEGSDELTGNGGYRPYLLYQPGGTTGGVINAEIFKVYAEVGERINMGSSANGRGGARIGYRPPNSTPATPFTLCPLPGGGGVGLIESRVEEEAGPFAGGYTPCFVDVGMGQGGVWEVRFTSPNPGSGTNPPMSLVTDLWVLGPDPFTDPVQPNNVRWIRAWDITVTQAPHAAANAQLGRVYADFLPLNLGNNLPGQSVMSSLLYIYTEDGYVYRVDTNGIDPFGFHFFANNKGFTRNGVPVYQSVQFTGGNPGDFPPGYELLDPTIGDDEANSVFTHKIFFNPPDIATFETLPGTGVGNDHRAPSPNGVINFVSPPIQPPQPTNFAFVGEEGTPEAAGTNPLGGTFSFDSTTVSPYRLVLDTNRNGTFGDQTDPNPDRIFVGVTQVGTNTIFWDGTAQDGTRVPAGTVAIEVSLTFFAGEVHFPFFDAENNPNGIIVERLIDPNTAVPEPSPFEVYYEDRYNFPLTGTYDYSVCSAGETPAPPPGANVPGCYGVPPVPRSALDGVDSTTGAHAWTTDFGNRRGMDTWAYYPSIPANLPDGIVIRQADLVMEKTVEPAEITPGGDITYTLRVTNRGPSDAPGARVVDTLPPEVLNARWRCRTVSGGGVCSQPGPVNGNIDTLVDLPLDAVVEFIIRGTVDPNVTAGFTNTASVLRPDDITDPNDVDRQGAGNNSASATVTLSTNPPQPTPDGSATPSITLTPGGPVTPSPTDVQIRKSVAPPFAQPGDTVTYSLIITNPGPSRATGIRVTDTLPAELEILRAQTTSGTVSFGGQTVSLVVDDLDPGESVTVTVTVRVRPSVPVPFSIRNVASLTNNENPTPRTASALLLSVGSLPSTGEAPGWPRDLLLIVVALGLAGLAGLGVARPTRRPGN